MPFRCVRTCLLIVFLSFAGWLYAQEVPQPSGWVNDFANVISPEYRAKITSLIEELEQKTGSEIAVVTIDSISPYSEVEYARKLFDTWKPGKKGKDNGVLVLLAVKERRWRIETGYGIEGILPDGLCGEIGRKFMAPYFKDGGYSQGLYQGVAKIAQIIGGVSPEQAGLTSKERSSSESDLSNFAVLALLLGLFIVFPLIFNRKSRYYNGSTYYGGGFGGFGGGGFGGGFGGFGGGGGGGGGAGGGF
jgi:uncharacterized protein